jgi:hypothetical protein
MLIECPYRIHARRPCHQRLLRASPFTNPIEAEGATMAGHAGDWSKYHNLRTSLPPKLQYTVNVSLLSPDLDLPVALRLGTHKLRPVGLRDNQSGLSTLVSSPFPINPHFTGKHPILQVETDALLLQGAIKEVENHAAPGFFSHIFSSDSSD